MQIAHIMQSFFLCEVMALNVSSNIHCVSLAYAKKKEFFIKEAKRTQKELTEDLLFFVENVKIS